MHTWMMTYSEELRNRATDRPPTRQLAGRAASTASQLPNCGNGTSLAGYWREHSCGRRRLCEELGIPRTPPREAIQTLAREWLVRLAPNRGAVVTALNLDEVEALYQAVWPYRGRGRETGLRQGVGR